MSCKRVKGSSTALLTLATVAGLSQPALARHGHPTRHRHYAAVIQCVAFARAASEIALPGNAVNWWENARGVYARGTAPEIGSVLNFRANPRMHLGHVAVVTQIVDSRTILIDQSHWHANGISRDVSVVDVSQHNDWSAVRVAIGRDGTFGSIYPTFGFIYSRADSSGRIVTARSEAAIPRTANAAPSDLRPRESEVAEVPDNAAGLDTTPGLLIDGGPDRSLR